MHNLLDTSMDILTRGCLFFTHIFPVITLVTVGYLFINRKLFWETVIIIGFTLIFNRFLKSIYQVPLPPGVGDGWAFPSGHMHLTFAIWGWIAYQYRSKWFRLLIGIFLTGVGISLIYQGYHYPKDVVAAVIFSGASLVGFKYLFKSQWMHRHTGYALMALIGVGLILISSIPNVLTMPTPFAGVGVLIGIYGGWRMQALTKINVLKTVSPTFWQKVLDLIIVVIGIALVLLVEAFFKETVNKLILQFLFGSLSAFWLTSGGPALSFYLGKTNRRKQ